MLCYHVHISIAVLLIAVCMEGRGDSSSYLPKLGVNSIDIYSSLSAIPNSQGKVSTLAIPVHSNL